MTVPPASQVGPNTPPNALVDAAYRINAELNRKPDKPVSLSSRAASALEELHADYLGELGRESIRLARRNNLATVDESHVRLAAEKVGGTKRRSGVSAACNSIGGVVAGAGAASAYAVFFAPGPHTPGEILTSLILSVIGCILLTVGIVRGG